MTRPFPIPIKVDLVCYLCIIIIISSANDGRAKRTLIERAACRARLRRRPVRTCQLGGAGGGGGGGGSRITREHEWTRPQRCGRDGAGSRCLIS